MVRIPGFHPGDPGSSPGVGICSYKGLIPFKNNPVKIFFPVSPVAQLVRA